jgi:hypothetical protein
MAKLALLAIVLGACAKTASSDLLTHGMSADISGIAKGNGTTDVNATLFVGDPGSLNFVELQGDDTLLASANGGAESIMNRTELLNIVTYDAVFQTDSENDSFTVDFKRTVDPGAPDSTLDLPAPFDIDPTPTSASRGQTLTFTYTPGSADLFRWDASGSCISATGATAGDNGSVSIPAGTLTLIQTTPPVTSCAVTVTVTRSRLGTLDTGYGHGGTISGQQQRQFTFTTNP